MINGYGTLKEPWKITGAEHLFLCGLNRIYTVAKAKQSPTLSTLPEPTSDLAEQTLKDPYNFDFLTIDDKAREREVEQGLMAHIQNFLLELGTRICIYRQTVAPYLSYNLENVCIVVELKAEEFFLCYFFC